ncbi:Uncharacterized protein FWK35_00033901 [Aphis craccivora]|uniref:PHD-type domain-containing protein n=1 Tax=Aphis craccivora TaxID=307492 RepID=A0A6G0VKJ4_APHCR|nr:Uncharacterized protein FWK35_00033901 [Aphis craccivora]
MVRPNCDICSQPLLRDQPSVSCHICKNLFHSNCTTTPLAQGCAEADRQSPWTCTPCKTTSSNDNLILILNELKSIKSQQSKSDEVLVNISSSISDLNSKVSQQGKQLSSLGQAINSLNKQLNVVTNDVKAHGKRFDDLETRITATEKTLSETVAQSSSVKPPMPPSINDVVMEIQQRTICASNIIIRGLPESLKPQLPDKISDDKQLVANILGKLNPSVPIASIVNLFRTGKKSENKSRIIKVVLSSCDVVDTVVKSYNHLRATSPDQLTGISISRDRTFSDRQSIREVYQELRIKQASDPNITVRYINGFPRIVPVTNIINNTLKK